MGSLGSVLKAAVVAGLIASAITAGFHTLLLEPLIERAIDLEEQASHPPGQAVQAPLIDRPTRRWGLVLGFVIYGPCGDYCLAWWRTVSRPCGLLHGPLPDSGLPWHCWLGGRWRCCRF
jgi:hypothetical protein